MTGPSFSTSGSQIQKRTHTTRTTIAPSPNDEPRPCATDAAHGLASPGKRYCLACLCVVCEFGAKIPGAALCTLCWRNHFEGQLEPTNVEAGLEAFGKSGDDRTKKKKKGKKTQ